MRRSLILVCLALVAATACPAPAPKPSTRLRFDDEPQVGPMTPEAQAEGEHWRVMTSRGPVHVWRPAGYNPKTAGVVIYIHGYYVDVDKAWREHRLAEQFRMSRRNALFVIPEAATDYNVEVIWKDPSELMAEVVERSGIEIPGGILVVAGHSGAFRSIAEWLHGGKVKQIILLDGFYGNVTEFVDWLVVSKGPMPRLMLVPRETVNETNRLLEGFPEAERRPLTAGDAARRSDARILVLMAQDSHMELVTEGRALPLTLRLTALPSL
jgi:hypothetical protein